jgi:hypothetical protein
METCDKAEEGRYRALNLDAKRRRVVAVSCPPTKQILNTHHVKKWEINTGWHLVGKAERKGRVGRFRHGLEGNIKIGLMK